MQAHLKKTKFFNTVPLVREASHTRSDLHLRHHASVQRSQEWGQVSIYPTRTQKLTSQKRYPLMGIFFSPVFAKSAFSSIVTGPVINEEGIDKLIIIHINLKGNSSIIHYLLSIENVHKAEYSSSLTYG